MSVMRSLLVGLLCVVLIGATASASGPSKRSSPKRAPVAVVYRGPAGCPGCSEAVAALLRRAPQGFAVSYIGPREKRKLTRANLRGVRLYAQPGGDGSVARANRVLGRPAAQAIRSYVAAGGHYLGFCMGAYLAGSGPGMGLLRPGNTGDYAETRGSEVRGSAEKVIAVRWGRTLRYQYAQDAAYVIPSRVRGERVLSRFSNGRVNALVRPYGRGGVGVVGTHPEADRSWYTQAMWQADKDGLDRAQGLELVAAVMRF